MYHQSYHHHPRKLEEVPGGTVTFHFAFVGFLHFLAVPGVSDEGLAHGGSGFGSLNCLQEDSLITGYWMTFLGLKADWPTRILRKGLPLMGPVHW